MKYALTILAVLLTGCSSMDHFVCYGAGTCDRNGQYANGSYAGSTAAYVPTGGQQVFLPSGGYMVIRSQATGRVMSVIQTSKTK